MKERGGFDSFEPASGAPAGPVAATAGEFHIVRAGWDLPQLTPPNLTAPSPLAPVPTPRVRVPVPVEIHPARPAEVAQPIYAAPIGGLTPCQDLTNKARRLRTAASQCDIDISNGAPYCHVTPAFSSPRIPQSLSAQGARGYAGQFEAVVNQGNERGCADFGGQGSLPTVGLSRARADEHYGRLCRGGDHYACNARQIEELCFDTSPMNNCVRDCLVTRDEACLSGSPAELARCRVLSHFQCYPSCGKLTPNIPEGFCVYQLPGWSSFR